ncbi:DUF6323 family protein [Butyrivibrio sp. XPD2006]|uniref:DUF6323 family protein n=1 Tax=Butyrivibrio sp. XPD2006 TaxID=1280668 RepID=UPI0003B3621F|nr:DUF6323 family protein [Butyrivibrio sp. XPD2006]
MQNNYLQKLSEDYQVNRILETNETSKENGLTLTKEEATALVAARGDILKAERRVEFGDSISPKLIRAFADSSFINQEDYAQTLARLQEIFFLYKNESMDMVSDEELLTIMKNAYENESGGDLEYLEGTALEDFARKVRAGENWADRYKREKLNLGDDFDEL